MLPTTKIKPEPQRNLASKFRRTHNLLIALTLLALLALPTTASAQDASWQLRFGGLWVDPDVSFSDLDSDGDRVEASANGDIGVSLAFERRFSPRLGLEIGALFSQPDIILDANFADGLQFSVSEGVSFGAITAGLNIHLAPDKAVDLYFGPLLAHVFYGDLGLRVLVGGGVIGQDFIGSDEFAFGAQVGTDIAFGDSSWSLNLAAKYLDTSLEVTGDDGEVNDLGFDPLILGMGFGYRF